MEAIREHWWLITGIIGALAIVLFRIWQRRRKKTVGNARSFAAIRTFRPEELEKFFGTYRPRRPEFVGSAILVVWFVLLTSIVVASLKASVPIVVFSACLAALVSGLVLTLDFRSERVIEPSQVGFKSPLRFLSWTVPFSEIQQCDLVPGRPQPRLRVHTGTGSFSLPLTSEMWELLSEGA